MRKKMLLSLIPLFLYIVPAANGDEISELKQQLAEQQQLLLKLQQKIEQMEVRQQQQSIQIEQKVSEAVEKKGTVVPESLKWAEKIRISGDLRYRHDTIDAESNGKEQPGTNQNRIRARLGVNAKLDDEWAIGIRIATGSDANPNSANQNLDNGFTKKDIWLDLAYFNWHPKSIERFDLFGGKIPLPFYRAGNNQLIWDDDVNPEGIAAKYAIPLTKQNNLYINGGGLWLRADSGDEGGASLWAAQTYLKHNFENQDYVLGGASFYASMSLNGQATLFSSTNGFGNTVETVDGETFYTMNYDVLEGFGEYGFKIGQLPTAIYGSYIKNTTATASQDTGWLIGTIFNKAREPSSWELGYSYRDIEKDAAIGLFTDSDFIGGGTDGFGHTFCGRYILTKNIETKLTYFLAKRGPEDDEYRRLMADLLFKF